MVDLVNLYFNLINTNMAKKFTKEEQEKIIKDYESGLSTVVIGASLGVNRGRIRTVLINNGVKLRDKKGIKHCTNNRRVVSLETWKNQEGSRDFDYFIGILASDGCVTGITIALEFAENNKEILDHYNSFLGGVCNINSKYCEKRNNTYYNIKYKNEDIVNYLSNFGIVPRKSNILKLTYINWDILRGIFDGDGSIIQDKRCNCSFKFQITSGSIDFINQLAEFYKFNNIHYYISEEFGKTNNSWFNIIVGKGEDIYTIYTNMYKDSSFFLTRKKEKFGPLVEKFTSKITS